MEILCPKCESRFDSVVDESTPSTRCPNCGSTVPVGEQSVTIPFGGPPAAALDSTRAFLPSRLRSLAHFQLMEKVGVGKFGDVWKAHDSQLKRAVAIKLPRLGDEDTGILFEREARAAARLQHPNVVAVHQVGRENGTAFIVSDFVQGLTLSRWRNDRTLDPRDAAEVCAQIADGLHHAHEAGVVHRDLKPANIMMDEDGRPRIMDFGLAKRDAGESTIALNGAILGTAAYMSPEQARGDANRADRRSDVFSLGVILYELITGERPFQGETSVVLNKVLTEEPKPPRTINPRIPRDLETICLKAVSKEPDRRYKTAGDFARDLRRFLAGEPITARRTGVLERGWRWVRRNRVISASVVVAVTAVAFVVANWKVDGANPQLTPGPKRVQVTMGTQPAGAEMYFIPLSEETGEPQPEKIVKAGKSPVEVALVPGDYLVVAAISDTRFHEVYRRVPKEGSGIPGAYRHTKWERRPDGTISLPSIKNIPESSVVKPMAKFAGSKRFHMGSAAHPESPPRAVSIPGFHIDPAEVTVLAYEAILEQPWITPADCLPMKPPQTFPITCVTWDQAVAYAELAGKRLPTESEFEFCTTNRGKSVFPWGDSASTVRKWEYGPVKSFKYDRLKSDSGRIVHGLFSNVAEWTQTRFPNSPSERVIRGGPTSVAEGRPIRELWERGARHRAGVIFARSLPRLGFRCARSVRPRIRIEDFERPVR